MWPKKAINADTRREPTMSVRKRIGMNKKPCRSGQTTRGDASGGGADVAGSGVLGADKGAVATIVTFGDNWVLHCESALL